MHTWFLGFVVLCFVLPLTSWAHDTQAFNNSLLPQQSLYPHNPFNTVRPILLTSVATNFRQPSVYKLGDNVVLYPGAPVVYRLNKKKYIEGVAAKQKLADESRLIILRTKTVRDYGQQNSSNSRSELATAASTITDGHQPPIAMRARNIYVYYDHFIHSDGQVYKVGDRVYFCAKKKCDSKNCELEHPEGTIQGVYARLTAKSVVFKIANNDRFHWRYPHNVSKPIASLIDDDSMVTSTVLQTKKRR